MFENLDPMFYPAAMAVTVALLLMALRAVLFRALHRWSAQTETELDDIIIGAVRGPSFLWCIAMGIYFGVSFSELPVKYLAISTKAIHVIVLLSVTLALSDLAGRVFEAYIKKSSLPIPSTGLMQGIIRGSIIVLGVLVTLSAIGISITPLITAMGVGGLAVALALKDTLSNLFAGIHIIMESSIRVGDFIRLESGQEGYVQDISWRTTRIKTIPWNLVIIPNSKLSQSVIINYNLPEKFMAVQIPVSVSYSSDPDQVERILLEETRKAVGEIPGLLNEPAPHARLVPGFGDSSLDFTLTCFVGEFSDQLPVSHQLRKRIFKRFQAEGIVIPFPQRTVHVRNENV